MKPRRPGSRPSKQQTVALGIRGWRVPVHSHLSYLWTSDGEFAEAVGFLEVGLRGTDHCLVVGSQETMRRIAGLLAARGFDVEALQAAGRLTLLEAPSSAEALVAAIAADFDRAVAAGAPFLRLLGALMGSEPGPTLTDLAQRYPSVIVCLYGVDSLPGVVIDRGVRAHPLVVAGDRLLDNVHSPTFAGTEARFGKVFQASPVALGVSTLAEGRIFDVSESWLELYGYRRDEVIGHTASELGLFVDPNLRPRVVERIRREGVVRDFEGQIRRKSGEVRDMMAFAVAVELRGEEPSLLAVNIDITDRKRAEAERARLLESERAARERLAALSHRLVQVQEKERAEIARELHDEVGQLLTGLRLLVEASAPATGSRHEELKRVVEELISRVRDLSSGLRPPMLDALGLLPALLWQFERFEAQTGIGVDFRHSGLDRRFPPELETTAFRVVQEALTNVARHAGVQRVEVEVRVPLRRLEVRVADRGRGFDVEAALAGGASGLAGMRERAGLLGGRLTVDSSAGSGTRVELELPLPDPGAGEAEG